MSTLSDAKSKVTKLLINMDRFDAIMNSDVNTDIPLDNGTIPSLRKFYAFIQANTASAIRPVFKGGAANQNLLIGPPPGAPTASGMAIQSAIDGASANAPLYILSSNFYLQNDLTLISGAISTQNIAIGKTTAGQPGMSILSTSLDFSQAQPLTLVASNFAIKGGIVNIEYPIVEYNKLKVSDFGAYGTGQTLAINSAAFASAKGSNKSPYIRVGPGNHVLNQIDLTGKSIYFEPGAYMFAPNGTDDSTSYMTGGYQPAADNNVIWKNFASTAWSDFHKYKTVPQGYINSPVNKNVSVLSANILVYDGRVNNAYDVPAGIHYNAMLYGFNAPASGCATLFNGALTVGGVAQEANGRSEITPISVGLIFLPGYASQARANAYYDFVISGPINEQEAYMGGLTIDSKKRNSGLVQDANHSGSFAISASTNSGASGFGTPALANQTTYPHIAMLGICGHSGAPGVVSGFAANADYAARYGILIGGTEANNCWRAFDSRSKFLFGILVQDFVAQGICVANAHPGAPSNVPGVNSDYDIWAPALLLKGRGGAPATPAAGAILYIDNNGALLKKNAAGTVVQIAA